MENTFSTGEVWITRNTTLVMLNKEQIGTSQYYLLKGTYVKNGVAITNTWAPNGKFSNTKNKDNEPIDFDMDLISKFDV